jgi:Mg-chelatase subunit ChlD
MKKDLTEIIIVLDKSGSMSSVMSDTIGGFNKFIEEQKKLPGEAKVTLALFDSHGSYKIVNDNEDLQLIKPLTDKVYIPGGMTALIDAMGLIIDNAGKRLETTSESERPEKVIMVIMTDGEENNSQEYTRQQVFDKIKIQQETYKWEFMFLGANQDAIKNSAKYGFAAYNTMSYAGTPDGTQDMYCLTNRAVSNYRTTGSTGSWKNNDKDK